MPLPPELLDTYRQYWAFAQQAASTKNPDGSYAYTSTELVSAAAEAARSVGQSISFQQGSQLVSLFGIARSADRANTTLAEADTEAAITSAMFSNWPTAAPLTVQDVQTEYMAKAQFTYTNQIGEISTGWVTLTGMTQLPPSVGNLQLRLQGAAMQAYSQTPDEGGTPKTDAEVMASFGDFTDVQLYAV